MAGSKQDNGHPAGSACPEPPTPPGERPALSVVIPAYNEADRLPATLEQIRDYMARAGTSCELIVVDDGSRDDTRQVFDRFQRGALRASLVSYPTNRGKGHAVRCGMRCARGTAVLICDADQSAPIEEVGKLLPWFERGYDVVIGSRDLPESVLDPPQPVLRRWLAWAFRAVRRRLLLPEIRDTQCGFKLFRALAAAAIVPHQTIDGWLFDCEVLGIADHLGYRIKEVGIVWRNHPGSRVRPLWEALWAVPTLLAIRRRMARLSR